MKGNQVGASWNGLFKAAGRRKEEAVGFIAKAGAEVREKQQVS